MNIGSRANVISSSGWRQMQPGKRSGKGLKWHWERRQKVGPQSGQRVFHVDGRTLVWWAPDVGANSKSTSMTTYCLRRADILVLTGSALDYEILLLSSSLSSFLFLLLPSFVLCTGNLFHLKECQSKKNRNLERCNFQTVTVMWI